MKEELKILMLEDQPADAELMKDQLRKGGIRFVAQQVVSKEEFLAALDQQPPDVILSDHALPSFDGFTALHLVRQTNAALPFIFVTGSVDEKTPIQAFEQGATDYVLKSEIEKLPSVVERAVRRHESKLTAEEREEQLRLILESARDFAIFTMDLEGHVTTWNSGAEAMLQWKEEEVMGRDSKFVFTPEDLARNRDIVEQQLALREGRTVDERWHMRKDGTRFWGSGFLMPLRNGFGEISGFLKIMQDHTQRRQMEERLQKSEEMYRSMVESVSDYAIYTLDKDGNVASWNTGAERIEGYKADEIIGKHLSTFFTEEDQKKGFPASELYKARTFGRSDAEGWAVRKDKSTFWSHWTINLIKDLEGNPKGFVKVAHDITERKKAQDEIRRLNEQLEERVRQRTAQLEATNNELEAFSYSVSHDLRAPLRHVDAYIEMLRESAEGELPEPTQVYLDKITTAIQRMGQLIDDLLTLSRMGRVALRRVPVSLARLVEEAKYDLYAEIKGRTIEWVIGDLPDVEGDPVTLRQVFINLISNSLKYSRTREKARIEIGCTKKNGEFICFVRDNGVGFDNSFAQKIFDVFQRLHGGEFPGTGIGLSIVRRVIYRHGGKVWAQGAVNEGATFYFSIPQNGKNTS